MSDCEYSIDKLHDILFMMLCDLKECCDRHGISFMLSGGTSLGAVRGGDFIPWDDDVDIMMLRSEYCKLRAAVEEDLSDKYYIEDPENAVCKHVMPRLFLKGTVYQDKYMIAYPGGKEVFIDIFPIDKMPKGRALLRAVRYRLCCVGLECVFRYKWPSPIIQQEIKEKKYGRPGHYRLMRFLGFFFAIFGEKFYRKKIQRIAQYTKDTPYSGIPLSRRYNGEKFENSVWTEMVEVKLRDVEFNVPKRYDMYFENLYGPDYMTPHPPDKRVTHHPAVMDFGKYD